MGEIADQLIEDEMFGGGNYEYEEYRYNKADITKQRMDYCKKEITKLGFDITFENKAELNFIFNNETVKMYPFTGWHTGKSIIDGRGIHKLIKQLKNQQNDKQQRN